MFEARRRVVAPPASQARQLRILSVPLEDEAAADAAGTAVEVLVAAPDGEIDIPVMEVQRHIPRGVGQVETDDDAALMGRTDQSRHVEPLPADDVAFVYEGYC